MAGINDSIQFLKGVGEKRAQLYKKLGIETMNCLLHFFPRSYLNYADTIPIAACPIGEICCFRARIFQKQGETRLRKGMSIYRVFVTDETCEVKLTIFNSRYQYQALEMGKEYHFRGKMQGNILQREMNSPDFVDPERENIMKAVYPLTEGLSGKMLSAAVKQVLALWGDQLWDALPNQIKQKEALCHIRFAYQNIHLPRDENALEVAKRRLVFEELFILQLALSMLKHQNRQQTGIVIQNQDLSVFYQALPFTLTQGQRAAITDALGDLSKPVPMNRLLQGDVGSGKTMVACALAFCMANNRYQTAMMAPTEILAQQHHTTFQSILEPMGIRCAVLTGSLTPSQKKAIKRDIALGAFDVVLGTHALIQDSVVFHRLGLVITDEQHRFGVQQRARLAQKGENPHRLVMSATPIPRTLAMIVYGDLDISVIPDTPKGRKPIKTYLIEPSQRGRAFSFIKQQADRQRQAYIVCPLIEEGEGEVASVYQYVEALEATILGGLRIGILHGKMKSSEKEQVMLDFKQNRLDLLVCTTVVEVGVDVPNAVMMLIENAEQFGLSQLHQLRGRIGRGTVQSHCMLVSDHQNEQTHRRLQIMTQSNDGFDIAEQDLKQRGPGDFFGHRQHGLPELKIANMIDDMDVVIKTRYWANKILSEDPMLELPPHQGLRTLVEKMIQSGTQSNGG